MEAILDKIEKHLAMNLPFAVYNKPNATALIGIFQKDTILHLVSDYTETGFVFASFSGKSTVIIPEKKSEVLIEDFTPKVISLNALTAAIPLNQTIKIQYESLIQKGIDAIANGSFQKVVLSRKEIVSLSSFDLKMTFEKLLDLYPSAFTYCFFHPKIGLWLGGFSEQLLKMKSHHFETMAVAGTQPFHENGIIWENKEKEEQQFVTDFIVDNLQNQASELLISEPYTMKAGNVVHIKTDIQGTLKSDSGLKKMLELLHPTPAVCGYPKDSARKFILNNEGYDREYYSGFLGELNKDLAKNAEGSDLYVNLRCLQIQQNQAILYIGGGVTKKSIPEKEWQETVNKSQTMKRILD